MGRHPLIESAALATALLFACSRTHFHDATQATNPTFSHPLSAGNSVGALPMATGALRNPAVTQVGAPTRAAAAQGSRSEGGAAEAASCPPITPAMVALGGTIFDGPGHCVACHGPNASGTAMAPSLHAHQWLNIDGSYASIAELVLRGVPKPKAHPEVMPPMGGADLSSSQVCAVAAEVYSLSHAAARPAGARGAGSPRTGVPATAAAVGPAAPQRLAPRAAAAPTPGPARPAAVSPAPSAPGTRTVSSGSSTVQITFTGTPDNYTIRVDHPDGRTSSTYSFSTGAGPAPAQEGTAIPAGATATAPVVAMAGAADSAQGTPAPAAGATATEAPGCPPIAPALVAEGRKIFTGPGTCYACHGDNATGTAMAPTLHAHAWLNGSGSYASIVELVTSGVPHPKAHPAPMPARGGGQVSGHQVCAVAAYVYSLSH